MSKYFKSVTSYQDLKDQYRKLLKENHPDNGGDLEKMQEINVEYDAMFKIWKDRAAVANNLSEEEKQKPQEARDAISTVLTAGRGRDTMLICH